MKFNIAISTQHHQNANLIDIQETPNFLPLFICQDSQTSNVFSCQLSEIVSATNCWIGPIQQLKEVSFFVHYKALPINPYQTSLLDHITYHLDHFAVAQNLQKEIQTVTALVPKQSLKTLLSIIQEDLHQSKQYINIKTHNFSYSSGVFYYGLFFVANDNENVFVSHQLQHKPIETISY